MKCIYCNRELKQKKSLERKMGEVCYKKHKIPSGQLEIFKYTTKELSLEKLNIKTNLIMAKTKISWCTKTWNVISGCNKISAGCQNCYAETLHKRFKNNFGDFNNVRFNLEKLSEPKHYKNSENIFVNALSDTFHSNIAIKTIENIFDIIRLCKNHNFLLLTKRAERMYDYLGFEMDNKGNIPNNVWIGVSVENQRAADERIKILLDAEDCNKWLSIEPLLEPINIEKYLSEYLIGWVVIGCESGSGHRDCNIEWIKDIIEQCRDYNVPVFVKQVNIGGKVIKDINQFPESLRYQEYPEELLLI